MKSIKERLQSLLDKKEYSIKEIDSAIKGIIFTPPIESIITYNYLHQKKEKNQTQISSENKEWKKLSCDKKYQIEEKFQKEYKEFDKNVLLIEKYLILDYHKKFFTVEDFYVSQNIRKAKKEGKPIDRARVEGEISWSLMSYQEKEEWEKLAKENEIFWLVNNNMFHNRKSTYNPSASIKKKKPKLDRAHKNEFFNNLRQYNLSKYQELAVWSLIHKTSLRKNTEKLIFREWYKGHAIYDKILSKKREEYYEEKRDSLSKEERKEFELYCKKFNLIQKYTNYMIKHCDNFEIRQKFTPYYFFYLDYKDELETIKGGVLEKVNFLENKWNNSTEKEKKKFQLKMFDFLYNESNYFNYFSTESTEKKIESQSTNILSDTQSISDKDYEESSKEDEDFTNNSYSSSKEKNPKIKNNKNLKNLNAKKDKNKTFCIKNKKEIDKKEKITVLTENSDNSQSRKEECNLYIRNNFQKYKETFPKLTKNEIISMLFFQWKIKNKKEEKEKDKTFVKQKNLSIKKKPLISNLLLKKNFGF